MIQKNIFRTAHAVITIDLPNSAVNYINENDKSIKKIHIFVFDPKNIKIRSLEAFANCARRRGQIVIVHCFSREDRSFLRKKLKGVPKGEWFHFNLLNPNKGMTFSLSRMHKLFIGNRVVREFVDEKEVNTTIWKTVASDQGAGEGELPQAVKT